MVMNSTKAVAVSIQAVSPELKVGASSAIARDGNKVNSKNRRAIIAQVFFDVGQWPGILIFMKLNSR
jgi:hypothetical protein